MLIALTPASYGFDQERNTPCVILREVQGERVLSFAIAPHEAQWLAIHTFAEQAYKPFLLDLLASTIEALDARVDACIFERYDQGVFHCSIRLVSRRRCISLACRSSDAVMVAVRCKAPLFARETVFEELDGTGAPDADEQLRKTIMAIETVDFGFYQLR